MIPLGCRIPCSNGRAELPDRGRFGHRQDVGLSGTTPPGFHAINGDIDLAYQGDPETGVPTDEVRSHWRHIWHVDRVRALVADQSERFTFFCGGSRNFSKFQDLFDSVFVLEIDVDTLQRRLEQRQGGEFGAQLSERRALNLRLTLPPRRKTQSGLFARSEADHGSFTSCVACMA